MLFFSNPMSKSRGFCRFVDTFSGNLLSWGNYVPFLDKIEYRLYIIKYRLSFVHFTIFLVNRNSLSIFCSLKGLRLFYAAVQHSNKKK